MATNENLPEFDPTFANDIDQESLLEFGGQRGPSFPIIQWVNGNPGLAQLKDQIGYTGGFLFVTDGNDDRMTDEQKEERVAAAELLKAAGWQETSYVFRSGDEVSGVWTRQMAVSLVDLRRAWVGEVGGETRYFPWAVRNAYNNAKTASEKRPSSKAHALVLVKGAEEAGPLTLTLSGMSGKGFDDALRHFSRTVIAAANEANKKAGSTNRWPARCFWLPLGADRDAKGKPKFTEVGKKPDTSNVTLPVALGLPETAEGIELRRFYIGKELQAKVQKIFEDNAEWREAWNSFDDAPATPGSNGHGHTNGSGPKAKQADNVDVNVLAEMGL